MSKSVKWETDIIDKSGKIRGYDIEEIMRDFSSEQALNLLLIGRKGCIVENDMMRANVVSHCSHGITGQSTLAVMMGADNETRFGYAAFSGFMAGSGKYHTNAIEHSMRDILEFENFDEDADNFIKFKKSKGERVVGYGHRFHTFDPRALALLDLCDSHEFDGKYIRLAKELDKGLMKNKKRFNLDGVCAAIMLDIGIIPELGPVINFTGRTPAYASHYLERLEKRTGINPEISIVDIIEDEKNKENAQLQGRKWASRITEVGEDKLITYDYDQKEIIKSWPYEDMVYLLLTGKAPDITARRLLNSIIRSYLDHKLYDRDIVTVRFSADLRVSFMYAGAAAFNIGLTEYSLGKLYERGKELYQKGHVENPRESRDKKGQILKTVVEESGFTGTYTEMTLNKYNQRIPEFEELAASVLLDLGVQYHIFDLFPIIGRASLWAAHYAERLNQRRNVFQKLEVYDR